MENLGNGLNIQNVPNRVVVEFKTEPENVTTQPQQIVVQIVLVRGLRRVNGPSSHVL